MVKSGLYDHMKMLIEKGKRYGKVKLIDEDGDTIDDEKMVNAMIEMFWGDLFCINGDVAYGRKKGGVDGGMRNGVGYICEKELKRPINLLKESKATDKSGMIVEYIKALEERDSNLSMLLNDVLSGGCIPREWKESRVVLVHKGESK